MFPGNHQWHHENRQEVLWHFRPYKRSENESPLLFHKKTIVFGKLNASDISFVLDRIIHVIPPVPKILLTV